LNHDLQLVVRIEIHQRPAAAVERDEPLLDQRRQFEPTTNLVDDCLFTQFIDHLAVILGWGRF
jgi:hypothetical protein